MPVASAETLPPPVSHVPPPSLEEQVKSDIATVAPIIGVDASIALAVCNCESGLDPYATGTKAVVGEDYGPCQVNSYYHAKEMANQGLDIMNWHDSTYFALTMMKNGLGPWSASRSCWDK